MTALQRHGIRGRGPAASELCRSLDEEGFATGVFPPAVLLEVNGAQRTEIAAGQLSEPGGVVITDDNKVYVTDGVFNAEPAVNDGRLVRVVG